MAQLGSTPYGTCSGTWNDNRPCSWEYGYERAAAYISFVGSASGKWWLDIETANSWRPGTRTLTNAQSNCSLAPFEGNGLIEITQYVSANLDYDYSCIHA